MVLRALLCCASIFYLFGSVVAQEPSVSEQRVGLSEAAVALDANGSQALEASLRTSSLNGAIDTPVTNTRIVVKNVSRWFYDYVSGVVTFYDAGGVRCGEGQFKTDVLAPAESAEVDTPGVRIRCSPSSWRIVVTNLVPRDAASIEVGKADTRLPNSQNLLISIDGEEHPIQLEKPMVLNFGDRRRTVIVRVRNNDDE